MVAGAPTVPLRGKRLVLSIVKVSGVGVHRMAMPIACRAFRDEWTAVAGPVDGTIAASPSIASC